VRGAFGIFHDRVFGNLFGNARGNPPFEQDWLTNPLETVNQFYDQFFGGGGGLNGSPFPLPNVPETTPSATIPLYDPNTGVGGLAPVIFDTHFRNSASNNWNFGIQRELPGNNTVDVSYIGAKGTHIYRELDGNPPDPTLVSQLVTFCSDPTNAFGCTPSDVTKTNLYKGAEFGVLPFNAVPFNALVQPFYIRSVANSNYHSLQLKLTHRLSHGLQVQGSYTWAHALDNAGDPIDPAAGNRGFPRNSRNLAEEYGNSDNDIRHVFVASYLWEAPIGRGKAYLNHGFAGRFFEGIQFSGITTVESGHPFDVFSTTDSERTGLSNRGDLIGDPFAPGGNVSSGNKVYFTNYDPANYPNPGSGAFKEPDYGRPGNIGRNHFFGPGYVDFDLVFSKNIKFTERVAMQLRVEGYNIFNHPHFTNPGSDRGTSGNLLGTSIFGQITSTASRPDATTSARQMQVALKLNF